jgi:hypothetical protein
MLTVDQLADEIATLSAHVDAATQRLLQHIRDFDAAGGWEKQGAISCAHWLSWRIGLDLATAREKVRVARALGLVPAVDEAFSRGELSYAKVRAITRVSNPDNQHRLLELARYSTGAQLERICRGYRQVVRSLAEPGNMPEDREVRDRLLPGGMVKIELILHPDEAALVLQAIEKARDGLRSQIRAAKPGPASISARPRPMISQPEASGPEPTGGPQGSPSATPPAGLTSWESNDEHQDCDPSASNDEHQHCDPSASNDEHQHCDPSARNPERDPVESQAVEDWATTSARRPFDDSEGARRRTMASAESPSSPGRVSAEIQAGPCSADRPSPDGRVSAERRSVSLADGAVQMAESFLSAQASAEARGRTDRYQIFVHLDEDLLGADGAWGATLDDGTRLPAETLRRLACDAGLVATQTDRGGRVLDVGRRTRSIPPAIRRALWLRDRGCRYPGCSHTRFLHGHHIQHWLAGGATRLENLALLCSHHHTLIHEGGFSIERADGETLVFRTPAGARLPSVPPAGTVENAEETLRIWATERGLEIGPDTALPWWDGAMPDYNWAVTSLLPPT